MKKKNKKIFVGALATLLILGGTSAVVGVASDGFKNWDTSTWFQDEFKDVKIESKTVIFDGTNKELEIVVPEGATYETRITKDGSEVSECNEIGTYHYVVTVKIGDKTKVFEADLIIKNESEVQVQNLKGNKVILKAIQADSSTVTLNFTINGVYNSSEFETHFMFADDKADASEYYQATVDGENKSVTIKNLKACPKQVIFEIFGKEDASIKGSLTVDYRIKVLNEPTITLSGSNESNILSNGYKIDVATTAPTFSVGSLPYEGKFTTEENFSTSMSWSQTGSETLDNIVSPTWFKTESALNKFKYKGRDYSTKEQVANQMKQAIKPYFESLFTSKSFTFDIDTFKEILTYQIGLYQTSSVQYGTFNVIDEFVEKFNTLGSQGYSLKYRYQAYGKTGEFQIRKINFTSNYGEIKFDDSEVIF